METRTRLTWLIFGMTNAVLFGIGLVPVLTIEVLAERAGWLIPLVVVASFALAFPVAWKIAPWLRSRYQRRKNRDLVS